VTREAFDRSGLNVAVIVEQHDEFCTASYSRPDSEIGGSSPPKCFVANDVEDFGIVAGQSLLGFVSGAVIDDDNFEAAMGTFSERMQTDLGLPPTI
jgi:hypothetical protein